MSTTISLSRDNSFLVLSTRIMHAISTGNEKLKMHFLFETPVGNVCDQLENSTCM